MADTGPNDRVAKEGLPASESRVRRPVLDRKGPIRDFSTILGRPKAYGNPAGDGGTAAPTDFVGEGVRMAYQVIDAYLKQGRQVAQQFSGATYGPFTPNGGFGDPQARSAQILADLMANWFDLLGMYSEAASPAARSARGDHAQQRQQGETNGAHGTRAVQLAFELRSNRPAMIEAEFLPGRDTLQLASHGLRCLGSDAKEIRVAFEAQPDKRRVVGSIHVPDHHPVGLYTGTLLNAENGSAVGSVSLRIR